MRPLTIAKLRRGNYEPSSRNPTLAQYLSQMNLMEQRGSGIRRMYAAMADHGLGVPGYSFLDGYFEVVLRGPGDDVDRLKTPAKASASPSVEARLTKRQRQMAELLASSKRPSPAAVARNGSGSPGSLRRLISRFLWDWE